MVASQDKPTWLEKAPETSKNSRQTNLEKVKFVQVNGNNGLAEDNADRYYWDDHYWHGIEKTHDDDNNYDDDDDDDSWDNNYDYDDDNYDNFDVIENNNDDSLDNDYHKNNLNDDDQDNATLDDNEGDYYHDYVHDDYRDKDEYVFNDDGKDIVEKGKHAINAIKNSDNVSLIHLGVSYIAFIWSYTLVNTKDKTLIYILAKQIDV